MPERKYSVSEIDSMRRDIGRLALSVGTQIDPKLVEERLRTYMLNGTDPEELVEPARLYYAQWLEDVQIAWNTRRRPL